MFMDELVKLVALGMPAMFTCGVAALAASLSRRARQDPFAPPWPLFIGTVLAALGLLVMAVIAWRTREDGHYDDFVSAVWLLAAVGGALALLAGVASYVPWLPLPRRIGARLPAAVRLAARDVDRHLRRTGELIAITMALTALAVTVAIVGAATAAQDGPVARGLGDGAEVHVELGFKSLPGWLGPALVAAVAALGIALASGGLAGAGSRSARVLLRTGRSPGLRLLAAGRAGWCMLAGAVPGTAAGCVIGLLLSWPMTTSVGWDESVRMPFETPWLLIAALATGLPAAAALIAALPRPRRQGPPHQTPSHQGPPRQTPAP